jgi:Glycosyl transferases group 1
MRGRDDRHEADALRGCWLRRSGGPAIGENREPAIEVRQMRVAVLAEDGPLSACTRYRALQHVPRLKRRLGQVDVFLPHDIVPRSRGLADRAAFFARGAAGYISLSARIGLIVRGYDALLVQRGLYPMGPGAIVAALDRFPGRLVFDLDDAVFLGSPALGDRGRLARWLYGPQQALRLLRRADALVVSTTALADSLPHWAQADAVLPTVPSPSAYPVARHRDGLPVALGWVGQLRNLGYLDPLRATLERLGAERVASLEVVSAEPWLGPATFRPWSLGEEASVFARFGVGLMPLPDTPYTRAKAGFKLLQYMAAGVPVVASPVGVNRMLVESSDAGMLATEPAEWEAAIRTLASSASLRAELGERGRRFVYDYADLEGQADTLASLLAGDGVQ